MQSTIIVAQKQQKHSLKYNNGVNHFVDTMQIFTRFKMRVQQTNLLNAKSNLKK